MRRTQEMAERTKNYDQGRCSHAKARSIRASVRTADRVNTSITYCPFHRCCNIALRSSVRLSQENIWWIWRARRIDFDVAVIGPGDFIYHVADTSHVGVFVLTANNQRVIGWNCNSTERACSHNTILPDALASLVMQSPSSVSLFVGLYILSLLNRLTFCMLVDHDRGSQGLKVKVLGQGESHGLG